MGYRRLQKSQEKKMAREKQAQRTTELQAKFNEKSFKKYKHFKNSQHDEEGLYAY